MMFPAWDAPPLSENGEHEPPVTGEKSLLPDPGSLPWSQMPIPNGPDSTESFRYAGSV